MPNKRSEWNFAVDSLISDPMKNRELLIRNYIKQMLRRTGRMIKTNNLPDTIPQKDLHLLLQTEGFATITDVPEKGLYAFSSGLGGEPNPYYLPTLSVVANPALRFNASLVIDKDCVVVLNDSLYQGLLPILTKYAALIVDAEISLKYAIINARVPKVFMADDDNSKASADMFFQRLEEGSAYHIVSKSPFAEDIITGMTALDYSQDPPITKLIEAIQYLKGSCWNELGLKAAFNMKREAINEAEASLNDNILYPLIDDMLEQQNIGWEKVNRMYGTNIYAEFDSVWEQNRVEDDISLDQMRANVDLTEAEAEAAEEPEQEEQERGEDDANDTRESQ